MTPEIGAAGLVVGAVVGALWIPFGVTAWKLLRPPVTWPRALAALVVVPSCWLLGEWLRSWQALGGPWAVFGVSQWQHPAVLALAAVGGVWLISFALVLANVAIVLALEALPRVTPPGHPGGPRGDGRHGAPRDHQQRGPAGRRQRAADRRAEPLRRAQRRETRPDRLGREQHRGRPDPAGEPGPAGEDGGAGPGRRRGSAGQPGRHAAR